jgi:hypothetical protein
MFEAHPEDFGMDDDGNVFFTNKVAEKTYRDKLKAE